MATAGSNRSSASPKVWRTPSWACGRMSPCAESSRVVEPSGFLGVGEVEVYPSIPRSPGTDDTADRRHDRRRRAVGSSAGSIAASDRLVEASDGYTINPASSDVTGSGVRCADLDGDGVDELVRHIDWFNGGPDASTARAMRVSTMSMFDVRSVDTELRAPRAGRRGRTGSPSAYCHGLPHRTRLTLLQGVQRGRVSVQVRSANGSPFRVAVRSARRGRRGRRCACQRRPAHQAGALGERQRVVGWSPFAHACDRSAVLMPTRPS